MGDVIKWNIPCDSHMNIRRVRKVIRERDWDQVMAIGYDKDGDLMICSSKMSRKDALWLLEQAKLHALGIYQSNAN